MGACIRRRFNFWPQGSRWRAVLFSEVPSTVLSPTSGWPEIRKSYLDEIKAFMYTYTVYHFIKYENKIFSFVKLYDVHMSIQGTRTGTSPAENPRDETRQSRLALRPCSLRTYGLYERAGGTVVKPWRIGCSQTAWEERVALTCYLYWFSGFMNI